MPNSPLPAPRSKRHPPKPAPAKRRRDGSTPYAPFPDSHLVGHRSEGDPLAGLKLNDGPSPGSPSNSITNHKLQITNPSVPPPDSPLPATTKKLEAGSWKLESSLSKEARSLKLEAGMPNTPLPAPRSKRPDSSFIPHPSSFSESGPSVPSSTNSPLPAPSSQRPNSSFILF